MMSRSDPVGHKKCTISQTKIKYAWLYFQEVTTAATWIVVHSEKTKGRPHSAAVHSEYGEAARHSLFCCLPCTGTESGVLSKHRALPWTLPPPLHSFYKCPFHVTFSVFLVWYTFHERSAQNKITEARGDLAFLACFSLGRKMHHKIQEFLARLQVS